MEIISINNTYPNYKGYQKPASFKAIKGLGNEAENLIQYGRKLVNEVSERNSKVKQAWDKAYQDYLSAIEQKASEAVIREKIKKLKEVRIDTETAALEAQSKNLTYQNMIDSDKWNHVNDQHIVKGFGLGKIAGYEDIKDVLQREFISKIKKEKNCEKVDIPSAFFFFGPKGNGKTTSTLAIAEETKCKIEKIRYNSFEKQEDFFENIVNKAKAVEENFKRNGRYIFFMDEFTSFLNTENKLYSKFIDFLKDCSQKFHCTFFGTTNFLGRAGEEIKSIKPVFVSYDPPSKINMMKILKYYVDGREAGELNYSELADNLLDWANQQGGAFNNSYLKEIVKNVSLESKRISAKDLLDYAKERFNNSLLDEKTLKNYRQDYKMFIEN